jgi:hypothetical protein
MIDPFRSCLALGPLAIYFLVLALTNFSRRPVVVSGARDTAGLGFAISGLLFIGPIELALQLVPIADPRYAWTLILVLYALFVTLAVLLAAPRIVVYNVALERLRPALADIINELDPGARWAGGSVALPRLHVEFYLDDHAAVRNVSLVASATPQSYAGWRVLERALRAELRKSVESSPNLWGVGALVMSLAMISRMGWLFYSQSEKITQGFHEMLRHQF